MEEDYRIKYKLINKAPGTLEYVGDTEVLETKKGIISYNLETIVEESFKDLDSLVLKEDRVNWIHIEGMKDIDSLDNLSERFRIHPLIMEDILNTDHRPKLEGNEELIFVLGKKFIYKKNEFEIDTEQLAFILKENLVITISESRSNIFNNVINRLNVGKNIRSKSADFLFYSLLDAMVDSYFEILEDIDDDIDLLEDKLLTDPNPEILHQIYQIKREMILIRKIMWPFRNIIGSLTKSDYDLIYQDTTYYLRDVHDHIIQIIDIVETYRDILSGMLDTYLSSIGNKTNDVMKVLTIFSTIFTPLAFLSGVYGTNFPYIPLFQLKYSYFIFWGLNIFSVIIILYYLYRKGWMD